MSSRQPFCTRRKANLMIFWLMCRPRLIRNQLASSTNPRSAIIVSDDEEDAEEDSVPSVLNLSHTYMEYGFGAVSAPKPRPTFEIWDRWRERWHGWRKNKILAPEEFKCSRWLPECFLAPGIFLWSQIKFWRDGALSVNLEGTKAYCDVPSAGLKDYIPGDSAVIHHIGQRNFVLWSEKGARRMGQWGTVNVLHVQTPRVDPKAGLTVEGGRKFNGMIGTIESSGSTLWRFATQIWSRYLRLDTMAKEIETNPPQIQVERSAGVRENDSGLGIASKIAAAKQPLGYLISSGHICLKTAPHYLYLICKTRDWTANKLRTGSDVKQ
ncbi:hypothetical protein K438DRAFT_1746762 [Mycena galopus ATCC 62051]|nr:hypothetical protein K438DRAFT_1746762 [Mycena galopus ATCC 62051]